MDERQADEARGGGPGDEQVVELLRAGRSGFLLVVTGAGISLASGIPTFRGTDPDAVWAKDVTELGTFRFFRQDPAASWSWYQRRFAAVEGAAPNAGHRALVELEAWQAEQGEFLLVTQNIDTLHGQAGSRALVEVHGRSDQVRCARSGCELGEPSGSIPRSEVDLAPFRADPSAEHVPRCPSCGDFLRQHVLWFDEAYQSHDSFQWRRVLEASSRADAVLLVGTSCSVGVTEMILDHALRRDAPVIVVDPGPPLGLPVTQVRAAAEVWLPALVARLREG